MTIFFIKKWFLFSITDLRIAYTVSTYTFCVTINVHSNLILCIDIFLPFIKNNWWQFSKKWYLLAWGAVEPLFNDKKMVLNEFYIDFWNTKKTAWNLFTYRISALQYCQYFDFIWPNLSRFQNIKWNALYAVQCTHIDWLTFWLPLHTMRSMLQKTNFTVSNMNHLCSLSPQMCLNIRLIFACSQQTRPVRQVYHTQHANVYVNNNIGSGNMKYLHHFQQFFNLM
jgi:hypothetical protein